MSGTGWIAAAAVLACLGACAPAPAPADGGRTQSPAARPAGSADAGSPGVADSDTGRIARLEREARALAHAEGCAAGQCRTAPVGSRPCGGPREYIVYCATTTDSAALFAKLDELAREEGEFNKRHELASTCEFRMEPATEVNGGICRAARRP